MRRKVWLLGIGSGLLLLAAGCPRRGAGGIDVDSVQGKVDQVDGQLKNFQRAVEARDAVAARKSLERAREIVADHADELAAYPEIGELKDRLAQAAVSLCAAEVQAALSGLFSALREKDVTRSRRRLEETHSCWQRCSKQYPRQEEISSLRAAVESAQAEIEQMEKSLQEEKLAREASQAEGELLEKLQRVAAELEQSVKTPPSAERLQQLSDLLRQYRREVEAVSVRMSGNSFWPKSLERLDEAERKLGEKFSYWQRRAELFRLAGEDLPRAEALNQQAIISRNPQEALSLVDQSHAIYSRCLENVSAWLRQDVQLGQWKVTWKGARRDVQWLKNHCKTNADITGRLIRKMSGSQAPVEEVKTAPSASPKPADEQGKKQKPRRGRIKRW